ncbi:acetyl-CoA carboxylase-like [Choristoneura fumiferana]|uniref:acetyl-CoA carboxylase-like n=1 Tax=Choristoneura fumiferana TaxID=7141 RepID=UPI003D156251
MEMYADPEARGGVLEAEGIVEVKFKQRDTLKAMQRLDPLLQRLSARIAGDESKPLGDSLERPYGRTTNKTEPRNSSGELHA